MWVRLQAELVQAGDAVPQGLEVAIPEGKPGGALGTVLERSRLMCLKQYQKPQHSKSSYLAQLAQSKDHHVLSNQQLAVYASETFFLGMQPCTCPPPSPPAVCVEGLSMTSYAGLQGLIQRQCCLF